MQDPKCRSDPWEIPLTSVRGNRALAADLVDTVARVLGSQPGCRVTHEDGIVLTGSFTATARAGS